MKGEMVNTLEYLAQKYKIWRGVISAKVHNIRGFNVLFYSHAIFLLYIGNKYRMNN